MNLPIQAAPIDRTNRAVVMQARVTSGGMHPSDYPIACEACDLLPRPISRLICKALVCGDRPFNGGLLQRD